LVGFGGVGGGSVGAVSDGVRVRGGERLPSVHLVRE
jgi:hypothetical protein